jgi:hypothetical protein
VWRKSIQQLFIQNHNSRSGFPELPNYRIWEFGNLGIWEFGNLGISFDIFHYLNIKLCFTNQTFKQMPVSKKQFFTIEENQFALVGRALSHPARIRILQILNEKSPVRNCDLIDILKLAKSTVHDHLKKMEEAGLIQTDYFLNCFYVSKNNLADHKLDNFRNM